MRLKDERWQRPFAVGDGFRICISGSGIGLRFKTRPRRASKFIISSRAGGAIEHGQKRQRQSFAGGGYSCGERESEERTGRRLS